MRTLKIRDIGVIKSADINLSRINIIVGSGMKTELMKLIYKVIDLEHKIFGWKYHWDIPPEEDFIKEANKKLETEYVNLPEFVQGHSFNIETDKGYIEYVSPWIDLKITKDKITILSMDLSGSEPDFLWYNNNTYFPVSRDLTLDPEFLAEEILDPFEIPLHFKEKMMSIVGEIVQRERNNDGPIPIISLNSWGYPNWSVWKERDGLCRFMLDRLDSLKKNEDQPDGSNYELNGEFYIEQKLPHQLLPLNDGLQYLLPIILVIEKRIQDEIVDSIFIDLPEHGLFPPVTNLLIKNLIDDISLRKSNATDVSSLLEWRPTLFLTTNSQLVINSILEDVDDSEKHPGKTKGKLDKDSVSLIAISEDPQAPLHMKITNASKECLDEIYNYELDPFYNIEAIK